MDDSTIPAWLDASEGGQLAPVDKLEVHRRGLRHPAVSVFLRVGEDLLWQQRAAGKYHSGGLWANACCTHARWGETPLDCAHRRMAEELGITGLTLTRIAQVEYRAPVGAGMTEHELVDVFLAEPPQRPAIRPDPEEVADIAWMSLPAIEAAIAADPDRFTPWLKLYLTDHRHKLFGAPQDRAEAEKTLLSQGHVAG